MLKIVSDTETPNAFLHYFCTCNIKYFAVNFVQYQILYCCFCTVPYTLLLFLLITHTSLLFYTVLLHFLYSTIYFAVVSVQYHMLRCCFCTVSDASLLFLYSIRYFAAVSVQYQILRCCFCTVSDTPLC